MPFFPVRGTLTGEDAVLAVLGRHHVVHDPGIGHHRVNDGRLLGIAHIDGIDPVGDGGHVDALSIRMHPRFGAPERQRNPALHLETPAHLALSHLNHRFGVLSTQRGRYRVRPRSLGDERAVAIDLGDARSLRDRPADHDAFNCLPRRILSGRLEANDVSGPRIRGSRIDAESRHPIGRYLDIERMSRGTSLGGDRGLPRRQRREPSVRADGDDLGIAGSEGDRVVALISLLAVGDAGEGEPRSHHQVAQRGRDLDLRGGKGLHFDDRLTERGLGALHRCDHRHPHLAAISRRHQTSRIDRALIAIYEVLQRRAWNHAPGGIKRLGAELDRLPDFDFGGRRG